jgi:hypothetical protein
VADGLGENDLLRQRLRRKHRHRNQRVLFGQMGVSFWDAADFLYLEDLLGAFGHWRHFVELGTCLGGTSIWLGIAAAMRGGELHTFDILPPGQWFDTHKPAAVHFHELDVLSSCAPEVVDLLRDREGVLLVCDCSEKHQEMELYGDYLGPGCGLIVDDYGIRGTSARLCDKVAARYGLKPWRWDLAAGYTAKIRAWVRCDDELEAESYQEPVHSPRRTRRARRTVITEKGLDKMLSRSAKSRERRARRRSC